MPGFARMTILCRSLDASVRLYRKMIVHDPDGVLVSVIQVDPLPAARP